MTQLTATIEKQTEKVTPSSEISFVRLTDVPIEELIEHMSDPRMAEHMPLLTKPWDRDDVVLFIAAKEACWRRDGLGHWAILAGGRYVGWGGFQREGNEWDFGLVLRADAFGLGAAIFRKAIEFALEDPCIEEVTFLLAPTRRSFGALARVGARFDGTVDYAGSDFRRYRMDTTGRG